MALRPAVRLLLWLVVLCIPLQGFGVAVARLSGTAHFHVAAAAAVAADQDHDHDHHHGSVQHHHHDEDDSVVYIDEDVSAALKALPIVASTRVLDVESMPQAGEAAAAATAIDAAQSHSASAFDSHVAEPLERPPR